MGSATRARTRRCGSTRSHVSTRIPTAITRWRGCSRRRSPTDLDDIAQLARFLATVTRGGDARLRACAVVGSDHAAFGGQSRTAAARSAVVTHDRLLSGVTSRKKVYNDTWWSAEASSA